jgi:hypothetical protein
MTVDIGFDRHDRSVARMLAGAVRRIALAVACLLALISVVAAVAANLRTIKRATRSCFILMAAWAMPYRPLTDRAALTPGSAT